jgi:hypothetical protein
MSSYSRTKRYKTPQGKTCVLTGCGKHARVKTMRTNSHKMEIWLCEDHAQRQGI